MNRAFDSFADWVPVRFYWRENRPFVDWCYMGKTRFTEPFFDQTVTRRFHEPFNLLFRHQTPIEFLSELNANSSIVAPTGFIFHLSRCGSTLISQMLAALEQNVVVSEPPPVDSILRANFKNPAVTDQQRISWLQAMIGALGRQRNREEAYFFVKFDSWSALDLALIERAFPDVPWIFLYRNPVEIIVSQMRQRGAQTIPGVIGQILPDTDLTEVWRMPPEEYCARVLARICESVLSFLPHRNALLLNYRQLPEVVSTTVLQHFRISYSPEDIETMNNAARFDAKTPQLNFTADDEAKRKQASDAAIAAAERWVNPLYENLENLRCNPKNDFLFST